TQKILRHTFNIREKYVFDDVVCNFNSDIYPISFFKECDIQDVKFIITSKDNFFLLYDKVVKYVNPEMIIRGFRKNFLL
ncbi:MAG: hypothetical protein IJU40_08550, partial [Desulfovibrionaceae bacterium]|nr:hypothetical protein [Desulfovibrionaceae bacterium]